MKLKKGDTVIVIAGKDKGKQGEISTVLPKLNKVKIAGVNTAKRHLAARGNDTNTGGIIDKARRSEARRYVLHFPNPKTV